MSRRAGRRVALVAAVLLTSIAPGHAQPQTTTPAATDPDLSHPAGVATVERDGDTMSGLVTHLQSYGADVEALFKERRRRYRVEDWTLVGTSAGSVSACHAARTNPGRAAR